MRVFDRLLNRAVRYRELETWTLDIAQEVVDLKVCCEFIASSFIGYDNETALRLRRELRNPNRRVLFP